MAKRCGTKYLAQTLNKILMNHIRERLPDIKAKLNTLIGQTEHELASYGDGFGFGDSKESRGAMVLTLMTKFANSFVGSIEGTSVNETAARELCGGARIYYIYNEILVPNWHQLTLPIICPFMISEQQLEILLDLDLHYLFQNWHLTFWSNLKLNY